VKGLGVVSSGLLISLCLFWVIPGLGIRRELLLMAKSIARSLEEARFDIVGWLCFCGLVSFWLLRSPGLLGVARYSHAERITCTSTGL